MRLVDCYMDVFAYTLYLLRVEGQGAQTYEKARDDMEQLLSKAQECARTREYSQQDAQDAKFAVCAWVDEAILTSTWEGAPEWRKLQLQREYYNTNNAGVEFFQRLEDLGDGRTMVREVYTLCLSLGFRGRFFHDDDQPELERIKEENLKKTLGELAEEKDLAGVKLFPEAYYGERKSGPRGASYRPFDWLSLLIPVVAGIIAVELYLFYDNSLNIHLLEFFGAIK